MAQIDSSLLNKDADSVFILLENWLQEVALDADSIKLKAHIYGLYSTKYEELSQYKKAINYQLKSIDYILQYQDTAAVIQQYSQLAGLHFRTGKYVEALEYILISIRHTTDDTPHLSQFYNRAGAIYYGLNDVEKAKKYLTYSLTIAREQNDDQSTAAALTNIGNMALEQGNYPEALQHYQEGLKISRKVDYTSAMLPLLLNIGDIYERQEDTDKALLSYQEAQEVATASDFKMYILAANLKIIAIQLDKGRFDGLSDKLTQQLELAESLDDQLILIRTLNQQAELMLNLDSLDAALEAAKTAVALAEAQDEQDLKVAAYLKLGFSFLASKRFEEAQTTCSEALSISESRAFVDNRIQAYRCLYENAAAQKQYRVAYQYLEKYKILSDSALNSESIRKINDLINKNEYDERMLAERLKNEKYRQQKEYEISAQRRLQWFTMGLLTLAIGAVVLIFVAFDNKRKYSSQLEQLNLSIQQNQQRLTQTNQRLDQFAHSVSHDIINRLSNVALNARVVDDSQLNSLQAFKERTSSTINNLIHFCENLLKWSESKGEEHQVVDTNAVLNRILQEYEPLLQKYGFTIDQSALSEVVFPEVLVEQIFINLLDNAIKHTKSATHPTITITQQQVTDHNTIRMTVKDNGAGIDEAMKANLFSKNTAGRGLSFIKRMLVSYGLNIQADTNETGGASFSFTLPTSE